MGESHSPHEPSKDPIKSIFVKFELFQKFLVTVLAILGVATALGNSGIISHNCMILVVAILIIALLSFLLSTQLRFTWIAIVGVMTGSALLVVAFLIIASALMPLQLRIIFIIALVLVISFCLYAIIRDKIDEDGSVSDADSNV